MPENEYSDTRFLFPDMFSFSFDPEILTFLWGVCAKKADDIQRDYKYLLPNSSLLQIFVPQHGQQTSFATCFKYTVVTGGITLFVGISSYGTFRLLQKLRHDGFRKMQSCCINFINYFHAPKTLVKSRSLELVLRSGTDFSSTTIPCNSDQIVERPCDLVINGHHSHNGSPPRDMLQGRVMGNTHTKNLSFSPINGEIATGDEAVAEVHGQYFGPISHEAVTPCRTIADPFSVKPSPQSPGTELMLKERYENLSKPYH